MYLILVRKTWSLLLKIRGLLLWRQQYLNERSRRLGIDEQEDPHEITALPDLTRQVTQTSRHPVCEGIYSNILVGEYRHRKVSIKVIRNVGGSSSTHKRLKRESLIWIRLSHRNIVPLLGFCNEFGEYGSLICPWYEHGDIGRRIRNGSTTSKQRFLWMCDIVDGVVYLHSSNPGLVHGDLKPQNVLIHDEGHAMICDFGLARSLGEEAETTLMNISDFAGTARFIAYELANTEEEVVSTTASDMYALGCIALELLFLQTPHTSYRNPFQLYKAIAQNTPPATEMPNACRHSTPIKQLWAMLEECWSLDPASRPSADQLHQHILINKSALLTAFEEDFNFDLDLLA